MGSGTIIDPKGIILTNKHVVTDKYNNIISKCAVGTISSISDKPSFDYVAETKYYSTTYDAAIVYMDNKNDYVFPYIDIFSDSTGSLSLGEKIEAIGFPSIGGATLTYTSGIMSGYLDEYIKTTTPLEQGNSGGAAYNSIGKFIGIPTAVIKGKLNNISYILNIDYLKNWLTNLLGNQYEQTIKSIEPNTLTPIDIDTSKFQIVDMSKAKLHIYPFESMSQEGDTLIYSEDELDLNKTNDYNYLYIELDGVPASEYIRPVNCPIDNLQTPVYWYHIGKEIPLNPYDSEYSGKLDGAIGKPLRSTIKLDEGYGDYYIQVFAESDLMDPYTWTCDDDFEYGYSEVANWIYHYGPESIPEGAIIRAKNGIDVYIVKYVGDKKFKRLVLSPSVFNNYGHLKWEDIMDIEQSVIDSFTTSELVRAVGDDKIYKLYPQGDTGEKRYIKTIEALNRNGWDLDAVYEINQFDRDSYITGAQIE
ncbi:MAG: serine protease [Nanoarchaeota archaeon]|nr:serine protease [Nanoarchaeota archaeon]